MDKDWSHLMDNISYCKFQGPKGSYHFSHTTCYQQGNARYPLVEDPSDGFMRCSKCCIKFPYTHKKLVTIAAMWEMGGGGRE